LDSRLLQSSAWGFFSHANGEDPSAHKEIGSFKDRGGVDSGGDERKGIKRNDGTICALPLVLNANEILGTEQTQRVVKEQIDIILGDISSAKRHAWKNYTHDWQPISLDWQNHP
jgi:hypothetical protein